jgi:hypothetical protein
MALKLNVYKTVTAVASSTPTEIYTAPVGYSGIVLLAQIANISSTSYDVSFYHKRPEISGDVITEIVKSFPVSGNDTISLLGGKLVLESGDSLILSSNNNSNLKLILSILETLD